MAKNSCYCRPTLDPIAAWRHSVDVPDSRDTDEINRSLSTINAILITASTEKPQQTFSQDLVTYSELFAENQMNYPQLTTGDCLRRLITFNLQR